MSTTNRALRAGVVGLGWAGQQHMQAYAAHPDVELVALAGREADLMLQSGDEYGIEQSDRYADYRDLFEGTDLDVVSIATPTALHAPIAIDALNHGVHTLSEKPMAENAQKAREMVAAAEANDRVLDVSFNHRRRGDVKALKQIIDDGVLGEIYYAKAGWLRRSGIPGLGTWFTKSAMAGGGPMMDIGIHMLDMALHLLGEPEVETVSASTYAEFGPLGRGGSVYGAGILPAPDESVFEVEDLATAFVRLNGGATLLLETSWASYIQTDQISVTLYGSEGGAVLGNSPDGPYEQALTVFTDVKGQPAEITPLLLPGGGHGEAVDDFLAKVQSRAWASYRGAEYVTRAAVVDAAYESAARRREVVLRPGG
ncbi:Gfo/Idh/MocA family protein [Microbacterium pygmaeum]|uniref:Predicted dehydrogenase n=1 Tax=Microbacterium pygmaeum TaxID=370764 RepID=A0A1G7WWW3_9MICO|nr:Gfo/Idh/MocA family oxidoreductase [Microbacterium pygmaeum]SDG76433.1 Predicted dehydrogenase [Microbacterium pygmaeum]